MSPNRFLAGTANRAADHCGMDIFKTARDAAVAAQRNPVLWPGADQRFTGYGVMGLTFRSGHYLAMRHIPASSIGLE
ncbi:hypothetical protein ACVWWN_006716 [Mycobacterium sp. URHB0021]